MSRLGPRAHAWLYRKTGGRLLGRMGGQPVLLLTTTGRRTHVPRSTPVQFVRSRDRLLLVAANNGRPRSPAWLHNVAARPEASVQLGNGHLEVRARVAEGTERTRLWDEITRANPRLAKLEARAGRRFPIVVLDQR